MHTLIRCLVLLALCFGSDATAMDRGLDGNASSLSALRADELTEDGFRQPLHEPALHDGAYLETSEEDQEEEEDESANFVDADLLPRGVEASTRASEAASERPAHAVEWSAEVRGPPRAGGTS